MFLKFPFRSSRLFGFVAVGSQSDVEGGVKEMWNKKGEGRKGGAKREREREGGQGEGSRFKYNSTTSAMQQSNEVD